MTYGEGKGRRAPGTIKDIHLYTVGCVHCRCRFCQLWPVQIHDRISKAVVIHSSLSVFPHIIAEHHPSFLRLFSMLVDEILGMALGGGLDGPGIDPIGTNANQPSPTAGTKGNDLIKRVQQEIPLFRFNQIGYLRDVITKDIFSQPDLEPFQSFTLMFNRNVQFLESILSLVNECSGFAHSLNLIHLY